MSHNISCMSHSDEFVDFWKQILAVFSQLDENRGGDIGITEFVRYLQKNAVKFHINKDLIFMETSKAFQAFDDDDSGTLSFIER